MTAKKANRMASVHSLILVFFFLPGSLEIPATGCPLCSVNLICVDVILLTIESSKCYTQPAIKEHAFCNLFAGLF